MKKATLVMICIGALLVAYVALHIGSVVSQRPPVDVAMLSGLVDAVRVSMFQPFNFVLNKDTIEALLIFEAVYALFLLYQHGSSKRLMPGAEHGTAKWANPEAFKPFTSLNTKENIILTKSEHLSMDVYRTNRNLNVTLVGGAGTSKTRGCILPNILQANTSYVITDPKGELYRTTAKFLESKGYIVRKFDLINMADSDNYNPFAYVREEEDILKLIGNLIANTDGAVEKSGDPFWEKAEMALLSALFFYLFKECAPDEQTLAMAEDLIRAANKMVCEIHVIDGKEVKFYLSKLDVIFRELARESPRHVAVLQYEIFKIATEKTAKSILIAAGVRLSAFNFTKVAQLTSTDNLDLAFIGDRKTALFVVISDTDSTYNFLVAMMYQQLFNLLCYRADFVFSGRLPIHVRFMLDEFANIGQIPNFSKLIATIRGRNISTTIALQDYAQLEEGYPKSWKTILANCDSALFFGSTEQTTLEHVSKRLGPATIDVENKSHNKNNGRDSIGINQQVLGRGLLLADEIGRLPNEECILLLRGLEPFRSRKYVLEEHPEYATLVATKQQHKSTA